MKRNRTHTVAMFPAGDDLPLFSGSCQRATESPYQPAERAGEQARLPGVETRPEMKGTLSMSHVLSLQEWAAVWAPVHPRSPENLRLSMTAYSEKLRAHWQRYPVGFQTDNSRYEVYLERLLGKGTPVPQEYIDQVDLDALHYRDCPLVEARHAYTYLGLYETTRAAATRWGITPRRVRVLCAQGRVSGAIHVGRDWLLPAGSAQPGDRRRRAAVQEYNAGSDKQQEQYTQAGQDVTDQGQSEEVD